MYLLPITVQEYRASGLNQDGEVGIGTRGPEKGVSFDFRDDFRAAFDCHLDLQSHLSQMLKAELLHARVTICFAISLTVVRGNSVS